MDPGELIDLGKEIVDDKKYHQEVRIRTAINRIYYGTLHFIRGRMGLQGDQEKFHSELVKEINNRDKILGTLIDQMKDMRTKADYKINMVVQMRDYKKVKIQFDDITNHIEES